MLFKRKDGFVAYSLTNSLPADAIAITSEELPDSPEITAAPEPYVRPLSPIEQSLQLMLDEKAEITGYLLGESRPLRKK